MMKQFLILAFVALRLLGPAAEPGVREEQRQRLGTRHRQAAGSSPC